MSRSCGERANAGTRRYCRGPRKAAWLCGERRSSGASEFCRLRRNERYAACDDEAGNLFGENGNCIALDDGDTCICPQTISFSVCCKWFRWAVLPLDGTLEAELFRDKDLKRCAVCGGVFVPKSNRAKYCPGCAARVHRRQKTESERKRRSAVDS